LPLTSTTQTTQNKQGCPGRTTEWACRNAGESEGGRVREVALRYWVCAAAGTLALVAAYQWEDYVDLVTVRCSSLPDRAGMRAARLAAVMATIRYRFDYG
jgi:hypothetical protein